MGRLAAFITSAGIVIMSICSWLWGPFDALLVGCAFFAVVDVATGIFGALCQGTYNSSKFSLNKKIGMAVAIAVIYRCDALAPVLRTTVPAFAHWLSPLRDLCLAYFIINDILSIFENLGEWGLELPDFITSRLEHLKDEIDHNEERSEDASK